MNDFQKIAQAFVDGLKPLTDAIDNMTGQTPLIDVPDMCKNANVKGMAGKLQLQDPLKMPCLPGVLEMQGDLSRANLKLRGHLELSKHTDQDTHWPVMLTISDMHLVSAALGFMKVASPDAHDHAEQLEMLIDAIAREVQSEDE